MIALSRVDLGARPDGAGGGGDGGGGAPAERLSDCHRAAFPDDSWSAAEFVDMAATPGTTVVAAIDEGTEAVVGVAMVRVVMEDAELLTIGVRPDRRGAGVGASLLGEVLAAAWTTGATALFLEVAEDNERALALYRAGGFAPIGVRRGYYRRIDGRVNALVMRRDRDE